MMSGCTLLVFFFFNDTATTEIYTLSLHDALPIFPTHQLCLPMGPVPMPAGAAEAGAAEAAATEALTAHGSCPHATLLDRKSTRLNSSHANISYAVFCLKKKKYTTQRSTHAQITNI